MTGIPRSRRRSAAGADLHTLAGAYALDAVTADDREHFERHLANCDSCRAEVRGLREATAALGGAARLVPREELREQTVRAAGLIRQLPPVTSEDTRAGAPAGGPLRSAGRAARHGLGWLAGAGRPGAWLPRLAVTAVVVLAVVAVGLGTAMHGAQHRLDLAQRRSHAVASVLGAPDATMLTAQVSTGGSATVVMSHRDRALVFTAAGLPALAPRQAYKLWLMGPAGARPAGMLPTPRGGMAGPMVVSGLAPGDKVALTVEPASGASRPTTSPLLMLPLGT